MRLLPALLQLCWMLVCCMGIHMDDILMTPQYIIVSQFACDTMVEAYNEHCPKAFHMTERPSCGIATRAHLLRDPNAIHPPKILFIGADHSGRTVAFAEDVKVPDNSNSTMSLFTNRSTIDFSRKAVFYLGGLKYNEVQLYIITTKGKFSHGAHCVVFYVSNIFSTEKRLSFDEMSEFPLHENNIGRFDWTADPYSNEAYYTSRQSDMTVLHEFPISKMVPVLKEGFSGAVVHAYYDVNREERTRSHFKVSAGAVFSLEQQIDDGKFFTYVAALKEPVQRIYDTDNRKPVGMLCRSDFKGSRSELPAAMPVIIIRDSDVCLAIKGRHADLNECEAERRNWEISKGIVDAGGTSIVTIMLFVAVFVLFTIVLLLCLCLCWLRHNLDDSFDEEPPRPRLPYLSNEPGPYQTAVDMSVDAGWNSHPHKNNQKYAH